MISIIFEFILFITVCATIVLWRTAVRKPSKPKGSFIKSLLHSAPIDPQHQSPLRLADIEWMVTDEDRHFFEDFKEFARVVNLWLADSASPWRLQELADTELTLGVSDSPEYGRRYEIFYNQVDVGTIEVSSYFYSAEEPNVRTRIYLEHTEFLRFDKVTEFLKNIAIHVTDKRTNEYSQACHDITEAVTRVLWEALRDSEHDLDYRVSLGDLELQIEGQASWYLKRKKSVLDTRAKTS